MDLNYLKIILLLLIRQASCIQDDMAYEPIDDICKKCSCNVVNDDSQPGYSVLDCTTKNFKHLLSGWPEMFGSNHLGKEIVFSMSGNSIEYLQQLPETEATLIFSCRQCKLNEIASAVFVDVPNIIRLDLSWNKLSGDVLRADVFRGRYNDVQYEPIALEELDLSNNQIHALELKLFEHTPNLRRLSLSNNPLNVLNESSALAIGSAVKIEHLDLSYTHLVKIPDSLFKEMPNLRELLLQGNLFTTVPENLGKTIISLYLGNNPITEMNDESFLGLDALTHLNISCMPSLQVIREGTFSDLDSLEVLVCHNNSKLDNMDISSLRGLKSFRELDISHCSLKNVWVGESVDFKDDYKNDDFMPVELEEFSKLRSLKLEGNPWHCDCELYKSLRLLEHHGTNDFHCDDEPRCKTPYELTATLLMDLKSKHSCSKVIRKTPKIPIYEPPPFLRPRSIVLSVLSVTAVVGIGLIIGFGIVCIKKRLQKSDFGFTSPVRYTTVRNSTTSTIIQA